MCTDWAHIAVDETGAPERILGAKLIDLAAPDGKLTPAQSTTQAHLLGSPHHAQPAVVSITQSTELGTRVHRRRGRRASATPPTASG